MLIKYVLAQKRSEIKKLFVQSTVTYHQYELLRDLQTSYDRIHAMSALISAASPEKMDKKNQGKVLNIFTDRLIFIQMWHNIKNTNKDDRNVSR